MLMMKQSKLLFLFLILFIASCAQHQAPPPVTPAPPVGGGIEQPKTNPTPTPIPAPPKTCMRQLTEKPVWLTYGHYEAFNGDDPSGQVDYNYLAELICQNKPWTGVSFHLLGPYEKTPGAMPVVGDWPWKFIAAQKRFDGTKLDEKWFSTRLDSMLDAFGKRGGDVEIAFLDQFCCSGDTPQKFHPFMQNNAGEVFTSADALYSSLALYDPPVKFHHIVWTDVNEAKLQFNFSKPNAMAKMIDLYFDAVTTHIAAKMKQWPNLRIMWKLANETKGGDSKRGDRSEIYVYVSEMFKRKGLVPDGKRFFAAVDREYLTTKAEPGKTLEQTLIDRRKELHDSVVRPYGVSWGLGAIHEIHGRCLEASAKDVEKDMSIQYRIQTKGAAEPNTLESNDGNRCRLYYPNANHKTLAQALVIAATVQSEPKKIIKAKHKFTDIKMEEYWTPWPNYKQGAVNTMLKRYTLLHLKLAQ